MSFSSQVKEELFDQAAKKKKTAKPACALRELFLESGSVSDPLSSYHLEIVARSEQGAETVRDLMRELGMRPGVVARKGRYVVYLKEADQISALLGMMEAPLSMMEFENSRILREITGDINRKVNCETANIHKTVSAAVRQMEDIRLIQEQVGLQALPAGLRDVAALRLENPEMPLKDLGAQMEPPLGKSGVNHRLQRIARYADRLRGHQDETGTDEQEQRHV